MPKKQPESVGEVDVCIELQARLIELGFEFDEAAFDLSNVLDALQQVTLTVKHPTDEQVVEYAQRALAKEGEIEIDAGAEVSRSAANEDRGAYVAAWLWVPDEDCHAFFDAADDESGAAEADEE
jgi:hypothetical protein